MGYYEKHLKMIFKKILFWLVIVITITYTPQLLSIQHRINQLQQINRQLSKRRAKPNLTQIHSEYLPYYTNSQIKFITKCNHTSNTNSAFLFQTTSNVYFAINNPYQNYISFYNNKCQAISILQGIQVTSIICDRGVCQSGVLHFIGKDNNLYSASQDKKFTIATNLANLQGGIVGGIVRNRGKQKIQIFIAFQNGVIRVFDELGVNKLRIQLDGFNTKILTIHDHHPYPIIVMQNNWISMLDTGKYTQTSPNCPYISDIKFILSQNYYGQAVYIITSTKIFLVDLQLSKKNCLIKREYDLTVTIDKAKSVSLFSNTIFIDDMAFNLTEKKMYRLTSLQHSSIDFIYKRSQAQEVYSLKQECTYSGSCNIEFLQVKKIAQNRSILFWLTIAFIAILFLSLSFMKKSSANNLDFDDPTKFKQREIQQQIMTLSKHAKDIKNSKPKIIKSQ